MPLSKIIAFKRTTLVNAISACKLQETFHISHEKYAFVELPLEIGQYILHIGLVRYKMPIPAYREAQAHKYAYKCAHTLHTHTSACGKRTKASSEILPI